MIEHVGPPENQAAFASEVLRLGKSYWVQTPSKWFPVEAHSGVPFYWLYPQWVRDALMRKWYRTLPAWWSDYIGTTRVLTAQPNGRVVSCRGDEYRVFLRGSKILRGICPADCA